MDLGATSMICCLCACVATAVSLKRTSTAITRLMTVFAATLAFWSLRFPLRPDFHEFFPQVTASLTGVTMGAAIASFLKRRAEVHAGARS